MYIKEDLINSCKSKNRVAQKQLYKLLLPYLRAVAQRYLRDTSYVKDVLQESFIKIFKNIDRYDFNKAPINKWAAKIVVNDCFNYNERVIGNSKEEFDNTQHEIICFPQVIKDLTDEHLLYILKQMPKGYFEVFNLFAIDGYNHEEISKMLRITVATSRKRLSRSRAWLKKTFRDDSKLESHLISLPKKYKQ